MDSSHRPIFPDSRFRPRQHHPMGTRRQVSWNLNDGVDRLNANRSINKQGFSLSGGYNHEDACYPFALESALPQNASLTLLEFALPKNNDLEPFRMNTYK